MAFLTTPDPTAGSVEVDRLPVPGSTQDDLNLSPVGEADWSREAAMSSGNPECSTTPESCLSALVSAEGGHLNLESYVLAAASPLAKDKSRPSQSTLGSSEERDSNLCPMASY